ncbi:MAG: hypothetical protein KKA19_01660 [Candidatus Margulisbacteria bacterium]|nr:hypothetical protein [Candidatus Margulisiibacteriota bacterium]
MTSLYKNIFIVILVFFLSQIPSQATVRFGVGLNWIGDSGMGMGFNLGLGWKDFGMDYAHYGVQPTLYTFGTVAVNHDRLGVYYQPFDFLLLQTGLHSTNLSLSTDKREVLGTKDSSAWGGPYLIISAPLRLEKTYFIRPFWGLLSVDSGKRNEIVFGISLGADFETDQDIIKILD